MDDKTLSTCAHNVKVIAQDGQVTLKGPVRTVVALSEHGRAAIWPPRAGR